MKALTGSLIGMWNNPISHLLVGININILISLFETSCLGKDKIEITLNKKKKKLEPKVQQLKNYGLN